MWNADTKFTGRVHSLTALIYYLIEKEIEVDHLTIGSSAQNCTSCEAFAREVKAGSGTRAWQTIGYSKKCRADWIMPHIEHSNFDPERWNYVFERILRTAREWDVDDTLWDRPWNTVSGGEAQRIALAIGFGWNTAEVLLLDGKIGCPPS